MGWFSRKNRAPSTEQPQPPAPDPRDALLGTFLELERARLESSTALEQKRAELELQRSQLELAELERIGTEKRKQALFTEELRQKKKEQLAAARARQKELKRERAAAAPAIACEECAAIREGRNVTHSSDLIRHNLERHSQLWLGSQN